MRPLQNPQYLQLMIWLHCIDRVELSDTYLAQNSAFSSRDNRGNCKGRGGQSTRLDFMLMLLVYIAAFFESVVVHVSVCW